MEYTVEYEETFRLVSLVEAKTEEEAMTQIDQANLQGRVINAQRGGQVWYKVTAEDDEGEVLAETEALCLLK